MSSTVRRALARAIVVTLVAGTIALGAQTVGQAAPPFLPGTELAPASTGFVNGQSAVGVAPDGTAYAAFVRTDTVARVYVAVRPPGGAFGTATALSEDGTAASNVVLDVDRQGVATLAWVRGGVLQAAKRSPGGDWSAPQTVSGPNAASPALAVGTNGAAALVWHSGTGSAEVIQVAQRLADAAAFGSPVNVSALAEGGGFYPGAPSVAMDDAGDLIAMWVRYTDVGSPGTYRYVAETAEKAATSATFTSPTARSSTTVGGVTGSVYNVAMSPQGKAFAVWEYASGDAGTTFRVQYAERSPGSNFQTAFWAGGTNLNYTAGVDAEYPRAVVGRDGTVIVAWSHSAAVTATIRPPGGGFSSQRDLSTVGGFSTRLALSPSGEALIVWPGGSINDYTIYASRRRPGTSDFEDAREVARGSAAAPLVQNDNAAVDLDDQGNGFVVYRRTASGTPTTYAPMVAAYDVVAPTLSGITIPTSAVRGKATAFRATSTDRIGPATVTWDFGDGTTAVGSSVSHTYAATGVYQVRTDSTDAAGNQTESTRPLQVTAAAVPKASAKLKSAKASGGRTKIQSLTITGLKKGDKVTVTCKSKALGCTKKASSTLTAKKASLSVAGVKGLVLKPKATLSVKVTRKGSKLLATTFTMVKGKAPTRKP
ncbi:PKD domain-containing protein [Nocardioides conyzicola]|uniref:PKD domain-containing protein n=1 Tax=Nocardioides conyzicola TaxID=1651781 RepID=A0ABP8XXJ4_9ACTN